MFRSLTVEQLEPRLLMAADWPSGVGFAADFFNHAGAGLSHRHFGPAQAYVGATVEDLITSSVSKTRATIVGNSSDLNGALVYPDWQNRFAAVYVNGGTGSSSPNLEKAVQAAVATFVAQGGSYFGSCRGAYLAHHYWRDIKLSTGRGSGTQTVQLPEDHPIAQYMREHGGTNTAFSIPFYGGPIFNRAQLSPNVENVGKVIAGRYTGSAAMIEMTLGDGLISVVPDHPESKGRLRNGNPSSGMLYAAGWLSYMIDEGQVVPSIKGELAVNQLLDMSGDMQKVGDGQYHRWSLDVQPGTTELRITTSTPLTTELYVTRDGVAYQGGADYTGDSLVIVDPPPGTWEVSVLGTHAIANGVAYTLTVTETQIPPPPLLVTVPAEMPVETWSEPLAEDLLAAPVAFAVPVETKLALLVLDGARLNPAAVDAVFSDFGFQLSA